VCPTCETDWSDSPNGKELGPEFSGHGDEPPRWWCWNCIKFEEMLYEMELSDPGSMNQR
jgi:hypothetical protein